MAQTTTVRAVLRRALANVQAGWCQGRDYRYHRGHAQYCARGAIRNADARRPYLVNSALNVLAQAIGGKPDVADGFNVVDWNDSTRRKKADVVAAFKKAIDLA